MAALFKELLCFFFDGTSRHLTYFNQKLFDELEAMGIFYAAAGGSTAM